MKRLTALALASAAFSFSVLFSAPGFAADYAEGLELYKAKNYKGASLKFEAAMRTNPRDEIVYYCALSNQLANNRARARQLYEYLNSSFPGSRYQSMATSALRSLGDVASPPSASGLSNPSSGSGGRSSQPSSSSQYSGPGRFTVPFKRGHGGSGGGVYIEVQVNNRPMTFHLDTGAHSTFMGANQLEELGLGRPAAGKKYKSGGVGDRQNMEAWDQKLDLKLGPIYVRDFNVTVQDFYEGEPLLGRDFLADWETTVDEGNRAVTFVRKGAGGTTTPRRQAAGTLDVPFQLEGRHMIVDGSVNGKPYKFYFDTGADGTCFSMKDLKALGLEDSLSGARQGLSQGVGGTTNTFFFTVNTVKVGPITKENYQVSAVESSQMGHPLLGQSFFGEYNYNIDEVNKVIHFKAP